jgi:large subunit ribosomal protein L22
MDNDKKLKQTARKPRAKQRKLRPDAAGEVRAVGRFLRAAPDKVRIMGRTAVGLGVERARDLLLFSPNRTAFLIRKVLNSAVANATENTDMDVDELVVKNVFADRGPMLKRFHPCAHGRAKPILKRMCHITVVVALGRAAAGRSKGR